MDCSDSFVNWKILPCNKAYVDKNGKIEKVEEPPMFYGGMAEKRHVPTLEALAVIIQEISGNPNKCMGLGFHPTALVDSPYKIMSQVLIS